MPFPLCWYLGSMRVAFPKPVANMFIMWKGQRTEKPLCNTFSTQVNPLKKNSIKEMEALCSPIMIFYQVLKNTPSPSQKLVKTRSPLLNNTLQASTDQAVENKKGKKFLGRTCKASLQYCCHCSWSLPVLLWTQGTNKTQIKQKLFWCKRLC